MYLTLVWHVAGLSTLEEGTVKDKVIEVKSSNVARMAEAKDPSVLEVYVHSDIW